MPGKPITAQVRQAEGVTISGRMAYRARDTIIEALSVGYESGFTYLESLLSSFCSKTSSLCYNVQFDDQGRFVRACLTSPFTDAHNCCGQKILGIDGSFLKHGRYKSIMLILVGRTGNGSNIILAVGICDGESESNCDWFLRHCILEGVKIEGTPIFSERSRGTVGDKVTM